MTHLHFFLQCRICSAWSAGLITYSAANYNYYLCYQENQVQNSSVLAGGSDWSRLCYLSSYWDCWRYYGDMGWCCWWVYTWGVGRWDLLFISKLLLGFSGVEIHPSFLVLATNALFNVSLVGNDRWRTFYMQCRFWSQGWGKLWRRGTRRHNFPKPLLQNRHIQ